MSMHKIVISAVISGVLFFTVTGRSEEKPEFRGDPVQIMALMVVKDAAFHLYDPPYKAKAIYSSIDEAKCLTPESLMESIRSERHQEWVDHNIMPGRPSHTVSQEAFNRRKQLNKDTNYFKLLHKLTFSYNGIPTAIIKYVFVDNDEDGDTASLVMQKIDDRWYLTSILGIDRLENIIRFFDSEVLEKLLLRGIEVEEDSIVGELRRDSMTHAGLNTESWIKTIKRLRAEDNVEDLSIITGRDLSVHE